LVTTTAKVKEPPGSGRLRGSAVLTTWISGWPVRLTVASSLSVTSTPVGFSPMTVTVSVWDWPATPVNWPWKLHE
jgi:hypothetical protein